MQAQGALDFDFFRGAFDTFEQMMGWIQSENGGKSHSEMERALRRRGFELMRVMYQAWLDRRSLQERQQAAVAVPDSDVAVRTRGRDIEGDFGSIESPGLHASRTGYGVSAGSRA